MTDRCEPPIDADSIISRLEEAGATILAMIMHGKFQTVAKAEPRRTTLGSYGWPTATFRAVELSALKIERMREAIGWLTPIPVNRSVARRVVAARSLVHPITDRHLFPWRCLSAALGADHNAIRRWHAEGISMIVKELQTSKESAHD